MFAEVGGFISGVYLIFYVAGDWGDVSDEDRVANEIGTAGRG